MEQENPLTSEHGVPPSLPTKTDRVIYWLGRTLIGGLTFIFTRMEIRGRENIPESGVFVVAPTHRSNIDTPIVGMITKRRLRFLAKDSLWDFKPLGKAVSALGGIPVHRGSADRRALRTCIEILGSGEPLVLFPEGTRRSGPVVEDIFDGAAYIATKAGAPIVPVAIAGSEEVMPVGKKLPRPSKVVVIIGKPLIPVPGAELKESGGIRQAARNLTGDLELAMQRLLDEANAFLATGGRHS